MKKYSISFLLLLITPCVCFGSSARYTQLVRQKQQKMEQLEKCMGSNKALQIAGVSTLGLTAVGVAGNIYEAKMIKDNQKTLEKKEATITEKTDELKKKGDDLTKAEADLENAKKSWEDARTLEKIVEQDIANITSLDVGIGSKVVTSGYDPSALPAGGQKNRLASAIIGFIRKCKQLKGNGIKNVSLSDADNPTWQNNDGTISADAMTKYWDKTDEFIVMECKLIECEESTPYRAGDECVEKETTAIEEKSAPTAVAAPAAPVEKTKKGNKSDEAKKEEPKKLIQEKAALKEPKKCNKTTLDQVKAKDGIVEDGKCKVTTCKGNLRKTKDGLSCECPGNDYKWDAGKQTCVQETPVAPVVKNEKLSNGSDKPENIDDFKDVKVTFNQGVALANLYAEKYRLNFDCESGYKPGSDDYLTCRESSGKKYVFHFDSLTGGSDNTPVLKVLCKMYSGTDIKRIGGNKILCQGIDLGLCDHMNGSLKKVLPNVSAGKQNDGLGEMCVFY